MSETVRERVTGHESFVFRYGWLPKLYEAIQEDCDLLQSDAAATVRLGIGRNMVKSLGFWGEATGICESVDRSLRIGGIGRLLLDPSNGWDPYLERLESLWLIHWQIVTAGGLSAWNAVFGSRRWQSFSRRHLKDAVSARVANQSRAVVEHTLDQHVAVFLSSYVGRQNELDDAAWCPLQELGLVVEHLVEGSEPIYHCANVAPVGLSLRAFAFILATYWRRHATAQTSISLSHLLYEPWSPGSVLRISEEDMIQLLRAVETESSGALRVHDTMDSRVIHLNTDAKGFRRLLEMRDA